MEATAVLCRSGLLVQVRLADRARARRHGTGACLAAFARRKLLVTSLEEPPSPLSLAEGAIAREADEGVAFTEILPPPDGLGKTVQVKFVLQKQCAFGEHFSIVGDDPALDLWDPTKATALDWSEDHVWTVTKDLPANKLIEFKFFLQDPSGKCHWQEGPNRTLQTSETSYTLVVYEDWDDPKNQKISEVGELSTGAEDVIFSDDGAGGCGAISADALQMDEKQDITNEVSSVGVDDNEKSNIVEDTSLREMEADEANEPQSSLDQEQKIPDELPEKVDVVQQNGNPAASADDDYADKSNDDINLSAEDIPGENGSSSILENDLLWGRKTLQQLLRSLGFD